MDMTRSVRLKGLPRREGYLLRLILWMRPLSWSSERSDDREYQFDGGICANPRSGLLVFRETICQ
jgi:hypothetical protein